MSESRYGAVLTTIDLSLSAEVMPWEPRAKAWVESLGGEYQPDIDLAAFDIIDSFKDDKFMTAYPVFEIEESVDILDEEEIASGDDLESVWDEALRKFDELAVDDTIYYTLEVFDDETGAKVRSKAKHPEMTVDSLRDRFQEIMEMDLAADYSFNRSNEYDVEYIDCIIDHALELYMYRIAIADEEGRMY